MAREMYLVGVSEDELKRIEPEPPKTPKKKIENFWYHYKWGVLGGGAALIALIILLVQGFTKPRYDYHILLVTEETLAFTDDEGMPIMDPEKALSEELAKYGRDINGDGQVLVDVQPTVQGTGMNTTLLGTLSGGDVMMFAFDGASYERFLTSIDDDGTFFETIDLEAVGVSEDGHYWSWTEDERRNQGLLQKYPKNLHFLVRAPQGTAENEKSAKLSEESMELLRAYITNKPLAQTAGE